MYRSSRWPSGPEGHGTGAVGRRPVGPVGGRRAYGLVLTLGLMVAAVGGCARIDVKSEGRITTRKGWVLLPVQNLGETHMAGERVEELLTALLRIQKDVELTPYSTALVSRESAAGGVATAAGKEGRELKAGKEPDGELELDERQHYERVVTWARERKFAYGIGGSVQEWRYRAGTEGEPAVGLTLRVIELATGRTVFTAAGASPTPGRGSLSSATQDLLRTMLTKLPLDIEPADATASK